MVDTAIFSTFRRHPPPSHDAVEERTPPTVYSSRLATTESAQHADVQTGAVATSIRLPPSSPSVSQAAERPTSRSSILWANLPVGHEIIGLAHPGVWTVQASFSSSDPFDLCADQTGLYRPPGFRAAPWSGFAYDVALDRRTGLVAGTKILTARGEVSVEHLLPGDSAMALRGPALLPIVWIGRCLALEPPVIIEAEALGEGRPSRTLLVAAGHPIFVDPTPVPARQLVNGATIHIASMDLAELFHVDVGHQEVLFAENVPLASNQRPSG